MIEIDSRVRLVPFGDDPEQYGYVLDVAEDLITVVLERQYRENRHDDGLREVPIEQVEEI